MSLRSALLVASFRLIREKRTWNDLDKLRREASSSQQPANSRPPSWLHRRYGVAEMQVQGYPCYTVSPRRTGSSLHVMHLHGGGYIQQIAAHHWRFVSWLIERLDCQVSVPIYPLAPDNHAGQTIGMVRECYDRVFGDTEPDDRVLMGDSAGGGLCLVLAGQLRDEELPQPRRMVLISPWLDLTMSDPSVAGQDRKDPYLGARGLAEAGRWYADGLDTRDPRVSPIFAKLAGLGPITVFIGTRDVLLSDSRRLRDASAADGNPVDYFEYPGMIHNWPMRRLPEGRRALAQITSQVIDGG